MGGLPAKHDKEAVWEERIKYLLMSLESKRKQYRCGDRFIKVQDIPTWPWYYADHANIHSKKVSPKYAVNESLNQKISLWQGDITLCELDAIVSPTYDPRTRRPAAVCKTIMEFAGEFYQDESIHKDLPSKGEAKIIGGYKLPAKYVINTRPASSRNEHILTECYLNVLETAVGHNVRTLAFPCIATRGVFTFSCEKAAHIALDTVRQWLDDYDNKDKVQNIEQIVFCVYSDQDRKVYEDLLQMYFPVRRGLSVEELPVFEESDEESLSVTSRDSIQSNNEMGRLGRLLFVHQLLAELGNIQLINTEETAEANTENADEERATSSPEVVPLAQWQHDLKIVLQVQVIEISRVTCTRPANFFKQLKAIYDNPNINFRKRPFIKYTGEEGVDLGALSRDFFSNSLQTLRTSQLGASPAFETSVSGRWLPCASTAHSHSGVYELVGKVLAHSALHGGMGIIDLSPAIIFLLSHPVKKNEVEISGLPISLDDITDLSLKEMFQQADRFSELSNADQVNLQQEFLNAMERCNYGYNPVTPQNIETIKQEILLYEVIYKRWDQIKQLREGMDSLGLYSFLCQNNSTANLSKIFAVSENLEITPDRIREKLLTQLHGTKEELFGYFTHFLYDLYQGNIENLNLADLVAFWTGTSVLTTDPLILAVTDQDQLPIAHCCFSQLVLSTRIGCYQKLRDDLVLALSEGREGFHID